MSYTELRKRTNVGWNTFNTLNVLSYSHLPEGFTINLCIHEYSAGILRHSLIGRRNANEEQIFPGARTYDGRCSQMNIKYRNMELDVKAVVDDDEQIILITPVVLWKQ